MMDPSSPDNGSDDDQVPPSVSSPETNEANESKSTRTGRSGTREWIGNTMRNLRTRSQSPAPSNQPQESERQSRSESRTKLPPARMPSPAALDRSIHNATDGHSKDEIIAYLKKTNAALTEKTAEMELTFMNQCSQLSAQIEEQKEIVKHKKKEIASMSDQTRNMQDAINSREDTIQKLAQDNAFQKQSITDLKNQLFQLQDEREDVEMDRTNAIEEYRKKAERDEKRILSLEKEVTETVSERDHLKSRLSHVLAESDDEKIKSLEINVPQDPAANVNKNQPNSPQKSSGDSVTDEIRQNWKQLEETQEKLRQKESLLHETQSSLATLEHKHKAAVKELEDIQREMKQMKSSELERFREVKLELKSEIAAKKEMEEKMEKIKSNLSESRATVVRLHEGEAIMKNNIKDLETRLQEIDDLKEMVKTRDKTINDLNKRIHTYTSDLAKSETKLQASLSEAKKLKVENDRFKKQLESEKDQVKSMTNKYDSLKCIVQNLEKQTTEFNQANLDAALEKKDARISSLEMELKVYKESVAKDKLSNEMLMEKKTEKIIKLEDEITQLQQERIELVSRYEESIDKLESKLRSAEEGNESSPKQRAFYTSKEKKYEEDIAALETEIADRDAALKDNEREMRLLEKKVLALEQKVRRSKSPTRSALISSFGDSSKIDELRKSIADLTATKSTMSAEITRLKAEIVQMRHSSTNGNPAAGYSSQQLNDYKVKLKERDGAIATLVKSSITQEQQLLALREELAQYKFKHRGSGASAYQNDGDGPSWEEYSRLQQESEVFAGQIIELDEEVENLRQQLAEQMKTSGNSTSMPFAMEQLVSQIQQQKTEKILEAERYEFRINSLNTEIEGERGLRRDLEDEIRILKSKVKNQSRLERLQDELDEVEENNGKLQHEVRELRRKVRTAQLEAEKVPDLEAEVSSLRENFNKMKIHTIRNQADEVIELKSQVQLQKVLEENAQLEVDLNRTEEKYAKLEEDLLMYEQTEQKLEKQLEDCQLSLDEMEMQMQNEVRKERDACEAAMTAKESSELKYRRIIETLKEKSKDLENDIDEQNEIIAALTNEVKRLRSSNMGDSDANDIILALTGEVKKLRSKQLSAESGDNDVIEALSEEVRTLHQALKKKDEELEAREAGSSPRDDMSMELRSLKAENKKLENEVNRLQDALSGNDNENTRIREMKKKIDELKKHVNEAEQGRTQFEKAMISQSERKLSLMQTNKDLTIDSLRKELSACKERNNEMEAELEAKIRSLEIEKSEIEAELEAKMEHKNAKIQSLEQILVAHERMSGSMKEELDQLQSGMETVSVTRRAEVEELQEELMDAQGKAKKYERQIASLKMQIEESKFAYTKEVHRLQNTIRALEDESESPMMRDVALERERRLENEYRHQLKELTVKVNMLQEDNVTLKHDLERGSNKFRSSSNDKWRNSALQEENIKLKQRLREYEGDADSVGASSRRSARIPRSPAHSIRRDSPSQNRRGSRDDISTYTEMTF